MGALTNAFILSSVDEVLGDFFRSADNLQDIRDSLQSQEFRAYCNDADIEREQLLEQIEERPEIEDTNHFYEYDGAFAFLHCRGRCEKHSTACRELRGEYEKLRLEASALGFNAADYMPRLRNGDIVGTGPMLFMALLKIEAKIRVRRKDGIKDPTKALKWMIQHALYYTDDPIKRKRKVKNLVSVESKPTPQQIVEENEDFRIAAKALEQLGYKQNESYEMIVEITEDDPDMSVDEIIMYILKHRRQ